MPRILLGTAAFNSFPVHNLRPAQQVTPYLAHYLGDSTQGSGLQQDESDDNHSGMPSEEFDCHQYPNLASEPLDAPPNSAEEGGLGSNSEFPAHEKPDSTAEFAASVGHRRYFTVSRHWEGVELMGGIGNKWRAWNVEVQLVGAVFMVCCLICIDSFCGFFSISGLWIPKKTEHRGSLPQVSVMLLQAQRLIQVRGNLRYCNGCPLKASSIIQNFNKTPSLLQTSDSPII